MWGDTVNTASRMESHGLPGAIQRTEDTANLLRGEFHLQARGAMEIKGEGRDAHVPAGRGFHPALHVDDVVRAETPGAVPDDLLESRGKPARTAVGKAWRAEDDSRVGSSVADGVLPEAEEMAGVPAHKGPASTRGEGQLRGVGHPPIADLVGADRVNLPAPQRDGCRWREVLIEVEPQRRRASRSWCAFPVSWNASFSDVRASISSWCRSS